MKSTIIKVDINKLKPSKHQVREQYDLDNLNIKYGIIHEPVVKPIANGEYEIVVGHGRVEKTKKEGLKEIDVKVIENLKDKQIKIMQAQENMLRTSLTPTEEAKQFKSLLEEGLTKKEISKLLNISVRFIEQRLELLDKLHPSLIKRTVYGSKDGKKDAYKLTFHKARMIMNYPVGEQQKISNKIFNAGLTSEQLKKRLKNAKTIDHMLSVGIYKFDLSDEEMKILRDMTQVLNMVG